ncbi:MAG: DUF4965 domain-containing protein [Planctomycetota bacterium]
MTRPFACATPLITHNPYFSVWSFAELPHAETTVHWTGTPQPVSVCVRVGGAGYRVVGPDPDKAIPVVIEATRITATSTTLVGTAGSLAVEVCFRSPLLPGDIDTLGRAATFVEVRLRSIDGQTHDAEVLFVVSPLLAVNDAEAQVVFDEAHADAELPFVTARHVEQPILEKTGDDLRIDWGTLMLALPSGGSVGACSRYPTIDKWWGGGEIAGGQTDGHVKGTALAAMGSAKVGPDEPATIEAIVAYDEEFAVEYMGTHLRPVGRSADYTPATILARATTAGAAELDQRIHGEAHAIGGADFALLCNLAYRQCIAAHGTARTNDGTLLMFSKENYSNGCMGTVDVTYPGAPFFLHFAPELLEAQVRPVLDYAATDDWPNDFAPHDLGRYPKANGQVYGGGPREQANQMPVEECANMLILAAALREKNVAADMLAEHDGLLNQWADYLETHGLDPALQLCTDDFAGHLPRNVNLAFKAIVALGAWGRSEIAQDFAGRALDMAEDGKHLRLAYDAAGSWSLKYNLAWQTFFGLDLVPDELVRRELEHYADQALTFGTPLDSRKPYTKLDWQVWVAAMALPDRDLFDRLMQPIYHWLRHAPTHNPMTDWYWCHTGQQAGFQARSVVGGVFMPQLLRAIG